MYARMHGRPFETGFITPTLSESRPKDVQLGVVSSVATVNSWCGESARNIITKSEHQKQLH